MAHTACLCLLSLQLGRMNITICNHLQEVVSWTLLPTGFVISHCMSMLASKAAQQEQICRVAQLEMGILSAWSVFQGFHFGLGLVCCCQPSSRQQWRCFRLFPGEHPAVQQGSTCPLWGANPNAASGDKQESHFQVHSWSKKYSWSNHIPTHLTLALFLSYLQKAERVSSCSFFILRKLLFKENKAPFLLNF